MKTTGFKKIPSSLEFEYNLLNQLEQNANILDLGCGNGALCSNLAQRGFHVSGIDCSEDGIRTAKEMDKKSNYEVMDASNLKFHNNTFDLIIIKAVFTVIPQAETRRKIMIEACRVLKNNGIIYVADFAQTWHNPIYYKKYLDNYITTGEIGLFKAFDSNGNEEYTAKHFSQKEIVDLYLDLGLELKQFNTEHVKTRTGNIVDGYKIILCKTSEVSQ